MNVARSVFVEDKYPERFPEFKRLMAFCDINKLRMAFYDEPPFIGICVYAANEKPVTAYTDYTLYYHTMEKKIFFLDTENWEEGFVLLSEILLQVAKVYGESVTLIEPSQEQIDAMFRKKEGEKMWFSFKIHYPCYSERVPVYDESKWLAIAQMRKRYPNKKFELISR